jgi:hypothetical protein
MAEFWADPPPQASRKSDAPRPRGGLFRVAAQHFAQKRLLVGPTVVAIVVLLCVLLSSVFSQ